MSFLALEHLPIFDSFLQDLTCKDREDSDVLCPRLCKFMLRTGEPVDGLTAQVILDMLSSRYQHGHMLEVAVFRIPYLKCQDDEFTKKMRGLRDEARQITLLQVLKRCEIVAHNLRQLFIRKYSGISLFTLLNFGY